MPRDVSEINHELEVFDKVCGEKMVLFYRMPTNDERVAHQEATIRRKGRKVLVKKNQFNEQVLMGTKVITGFKKGAFAFKKQLFSSDENDSAYAQDWRDKVVLGASDILAVLGRHVINSVDADNEDLFEEVEDFGQDPLQPSTPTSTGAEASSTPPPSA
jgi:hypothetical protein